MIVEAAIPRHITGIYVFAVVNLMALLCLSGVEGDIVVTDLDSNETVVRYPDLPARFGDDFPEEGLKGRTVPAEPPEACSPVKPPPNETSSYAWILVIARGGKCQFSDKVLNAQMHNYSAAIVYNYVHDEDRVPMGGGANGSRVTIPSTFVGYSTGMNLKTIYNHRTEYIIKIVEEGDDIPYTSLLWLFAIVVAICFLMVMVFVIIKFVRDHASRRFNRLSRKHLKKIPVRKFKKGDYYDTCAICLDEYEEGEKIRVLPCDHVYHTKCIDPWLTKNKKTCPVCKRRVIPGRDADSESGSESDEGGASSRSGSESTPLLAGEAAAQPTRPLRPRSHGSTQDGDDDATPQATVATTHNEYGAIVDLDSDVQHGAVGGAGISNHHSHPVGTSATVSGQGNVQEVEEVRREDRKRKRHERDKRARREQAPLAEEETESASAPLVSETREERRERRRRKKERRRAERAAANEDGANPQGEGGEDNGMDVMADEVVEPGSRLVTQEAGAANKGSPVPAEVVQQEAKEQEEETDKREDYINPSYSESQEVVIPKPGRRHEMNEMV